MHKYDNIICNILNINICVYICTYTYIFIPLVDTVIKSKYVQLIIDDVEDKSHLLHLFTIDNYAKWSYWLIGRSYGCMVIMEQSYVKNYSLFPFITQCEDKEMLGSYKDFLRRLNREKNGRKKRSEREEYMLFRETA